jgi:D-methionine transport system ATP-binding protein
VFSTPRTAAARRFVRSALHDRPDADTLRRLRSRHPGRLVSVAVTDAPGLQQRIDAAFAGAGVRTELVHGGVAELRERRIGSLTYEATGAAGAVDAALHALRAAGIRTEEEV